MPEYDRTNTGTFSKNKDKDPENPDHKNKADITGELDVDGKKYFFDGWLKQRSDGSGSFYSTRIKAKGERR